MGAVDAVDLTLESSSDEDDETPQQRAAREEQQRHNIMAFARNVAARKQQQQQEAAAAAADAAAAGAAAAGAGTSGGGGGAPAAAAGPSSASAAMMTNLDLRALHEARLARQQAAAGRDSSGGGGSDPRARPAAADEDDRAPPPPAPKRRRRSQSPPRGGSAAANAAGSAPAAAPAAAAAAPAAATAALPRVSLLTHNVWFREDVQVEKRMQAIGALVKEADYPTFVCFQECTPLIVRLLSAQPFWRRYAACDAPALGSAGPPYFTMLLVNRDAAAQAGGRLTFENAPFSNSVMGRGLRSVELRLGGGAAPLTVATTHLESPVPPEQWFSGPRVAQLTASLRQLDARGRGGDALLAGDLNWTESRDGELPLPDGWQDAWPALRPGDDGATYAPRLNPMLVMKSLPPLRLDRVLVRLRRWRLASVRLVGTAPLPGVTYTHTFRSGGRKVLPVLPSDHFGLLVELEPVASAAAAAGE